MSEEKDNQDQDNFHDPLAAEQNLRGPILWAVLIFVPILMAMVAAVFRAPAPETPPRATVQVEEGADEMAEPPVLAPHRASRRGGKAPRQAGACENDLWLGEVFDEDKVKQLKISGWTYRIVPKGSMITMDHNPKRLNVELDEKAVIIRSWCG